MYLRMSDQTQSDDNQNINIKCLILIQINVFYIIQMFKRLAIGLLLFAVVLSTSQPLILINSSHTHNSFHLVLSIEPNNLLEIYSKKIVKSVDNWAQINTHEAPALITPPFSKDLLIVNTPHEGRHILQYLDKATSNDLSRHFHYIAIKNEGTVFEYFLPSFSELVPAFRLDRIYKCSETIVSIDWINGDAHIVVFSERDKWRIAENIDGGFRGAERGISYGYAIDYGHVHPVKLYIADHHYCIIDSKTPSATFKFDFEVRENYELNDILYLAGPTLQIHDGRVKVQEL